MYFYTNGQVAWLKIAKNACSSWSSVFEKLGWQKHDLYIPEIDISNLNFFALIQDPEKRHTAGIVQYLRREGLFDLLDNVEYQRLVVSACFDEHTYTIHSMVPDSLIKRTQWFVMDHDRYNYETLARNFLKTHGIDLPPIPRLNQSPPKAQLLKQKVNDLKKIYADSYTKLQKNYLGSDLRLYRTQMLQQHLWDR